MTILVLGGGISKEGILPKHVKARLRLAAKIFKKYPKAKILLSGKYSFLYPKNILPPKTEAAAMKDYLLALGIPAETIFLEQKSKDTISNAYFTKTLYFIPKKEKKAVIVTSEFHLPRTRYIFKKIFGKKYTLKYVSVPSHLKGKKRQEVISRQKELLKKTKKILAGMKEGNHRFLKGKFFKIKYYKEKRPDWVIKFVTQGK